MKNGNGKAKKTNGKKAADEVTLLQIVEKPKAGRFNAFTSQARNRFIHFFTLGCGNVTYACEWSGVSRQTYYRWMRSTTRVNKKFQRMINDVQPEERRLDIFEGALLDRAIKGDTTAIIYGLKTKGRGRGYVEAKDEPKQEELNPSLVSLKMGIEMRAEEKGIDFEEELRNFLNSRYAEKIRPEIKHQLASELVH